MKWPLAVVLAFAHLSVSTPLSSWNDLSVKHSWDEVPRGWVYHSAAPADHKFDMRIALKQDKIDALIANLWETSDPNHSRYGQHLTPAEAEALVAPHADSREAVNGWLEHHGVAPENVAYSSGGGEWVTIRVSVAEAERMLNTKYNVYYHSTSSERVVRTLSYSLPRDLHRHVDVVAPTTYFGTLRSMRSTSFLEPITEAASGTTGNKLNTAAANCATSITPACLRQLYNTTDYVPKAAGVNKLGVAGYLEEFANRADFQSFFKQFRPDATGANYTTLLVNNGGDDQAKPGIEANLDIQYTAGISFPTPNIYYSTGGSPPFIPDTFTPTNTHEPYLDWLNYILNSTTIPQTISTSYGDNEQTVPHDYAVKVCNLFAQLGSMGSTVFFSSGDYGVGGGDCKTNDGRNTTIFQPAFPASCPFVTAVGGTTGVAPEVAVDFSGGGFSRYFDQPSYQNTTVNAYLRKLGNKHSGLYNRRGRAYPDLSAQGRAFQVFVGGKITSVSGTSASAPTVAGIFSLLNDARLAAGKPSLGFVNPLIYSTAASGFNDIVSGSNPGCGTDGFPVGPGWDPVTGMGTPDFVKLRKLIGN